jgi:hypothetical protein
MLKKFIATAFPVKSYRVQAQDAAVMRTLTWIGILIGLIIT